MSFVDAHDFPVDLVLRVLGIPASTYYGWRARQVSPSRRQLEDAELLEMIVKIRTAHEFAGTYGSPRVWLQLRRQEDEDVHGVPATVFQQMPLTPRQGMSRPGLRPLCRSASANPVRRS